MSLIHNAGSAHSVTAQMRSTGSSAFLTTCAFILYQKYKRRNPNTNTEGNPEAQLASGWAWT